MTNENRPFPFMINYLMTLYGCYQELDRRFAVVNSGRVTKTARIESIVLNVLKSTGKPFGYVNFDDERLAYLRREALSHRRRVHECARECVSGSNAD